MIDEKLIAGVKSLRTFVPAKDFALSQRFYADLGFAVALLDDRLAAVRLGPHGFLLQDYYVPEWADNFMMSMMVTGLDAWWTHIAALDLAARYGVRSPRPPKLESWGLREVHVIDPAGVLWHFAEVTVTN